MRTRPVHVATVLGCAATVLLTGLSGGASAATPTPGDATTSINRAGYAVTGGVMSVTAEWRVPTVTCGAGASYSNFRIGLARGAKTLQVGTAADCHHGAAEYHAWFRGPGHGVGEVVKAGDLMRASISAPGDQVGYDIEDRTQGWGLGTASSSHTTFTTAAVVVNARVAASGAVLPLADFGSVHFHATVDHAPMAVRDPNAVTMVSRDGITMAQPGAMNPTGGFTVSWLHA